MPAGLLGDPTAVGLYLLDDLDIAASELRAAHAAERAEAFTGDLEAALEAGDEEALRQLVADYDDIADDPYFGYEVMERLGLHDHWSDPLHSLLYSASLNEDAATTLLLGEMNVGDTGEWDSVVGYLVNGRGGRMYESMPFQDEGALLASVVADYGIDRTDPRSVELSGHYLNALLETLGNGTFQNGRAIGPDAFAGARSASADVVIAHIEDFSHATTNPASGGGRQTIAERFGDTVVQFNASGRDSFHLLFGELALDQPDDLVMKFDSESGKLSDLPALQRVLTAIMAHGGESLGEALDGTVPGTVPRAAETETERQTSLLMRALNGAEMSLSEVAADKDAVGEMLISMVDDGTGLVSLPGGLAGRVGKHAIGEAAEHLIMALVDTDNLERMQGSAADWRVASRILLDD